ncbi:hypothetical protein [Shewanella frigidimarina]|uniref:hypothetical protein n=1 Tax=Shewanella frigidimarina TaxID=56812 RepID=UPI003D791CC3
MSTKKKPYQDQIDNLCKLLKVDQHLYDDKTTIAELEDIINQLEAKLPDDDAESNSSDTPASTGNVDDSAAQADPALIAESQASSTEVKVSAATGVPSDLASSIAVGDVEINGLSNGDVEVEATSTFRCNVDGKRVTVLRGQRVNLPEDIAFDAVSSNVACLVGRIK